MFSADAAVKLTGGPQRSACLTPLLIAESSQRNQNGKSR
jgi:hypothetical protein